MQKEAKSSIANTATTVRKQCIYNHVHVPFCSYTCDVNCFMFLLHFQGNDHLAQQLQQLRKQVSEFNAEKREFQNDVAVSTETPQLS